MNAHAYLADTSVMTRRRLPSVTEQLSTLANRGGLALCGIVTLELGRGARNRADHQALMALCASLPHAPIDAATFGRAREVQELLAFSGRHQLPPPDLLVAAAAEQAGMTVLHYDSDFERIAEVTGQPHRWIAPRGTL